MENALLMTGLLILAALAGGVIGAACGRKRDAPEVEDRLADLEDRLDALADHCMEEGQRLRERVSECELLIGETPDDGLLNRVAKLEEAKGGRYSGSCLSGLADKIEAVKERLDAFENSMTLEMTGLREDMEMRHG